MAALTCIICFDGVAADALAVDEEARRARRDVAHERGKREDLCSVSRHPMWRRHAPEPCAGLPWRSHAR